MENASPARGPGFDTPAPVNLPNANTILVLGILTIFLSWWHLLSVTGLVLGFVVLVLSNRETRLYHASPGAYTLNSYNNVKAGRTCAIIGLVISLIIFIFAMLLVLGILVSLPFWGMIR